MLELAGAINGIWQINGKQTEGRPHGCIHTGPNKWTAGSLQMNSPGKHPDVDCGSMYGSPQFAQQFDCICSKGNIDFLVFSNEIKKIIRFSSYLSLMSLFKFQLLGELLKMGALSNVRRRNESCRSHLQLYLRNCKNITNQPNKIQVAKNLNKKTKKYSSY